MAYASNTGYTESELTQVWDYAMAEVFPGGPAQNHLETADLLDALDTRLTGYTAFTTLVVVKMRIYDLLEEPYVADAKTKRRVVTDAVQALSRTGVSLDPKVARQTVEFALTRMPLTLPLEADENGPLFQHDVSMEKALLIARVNAYRIARFKLRHSIYVDRTDEQAITNYISREMDTVFTSKAVKKRQDINKVATTEQAHDLAFAVANHLLNTQTIAEKASKTDYPQKKMRALLDNDLLTVINLIEDKIPTHRYDDWDQNEEKAAEVERIPYFIALTMGEIGLLKDSIGRQRQKGSWRN